VDILTSVAFTAGFLIEMICNYFLTSFYTFKMRPTWKNAGGFLLGRTVNYFIQLLFLNVLIWLHLSEEMSGILAIMLAGVINYFVLRPFYKDKKRE
jgi:putative flippase GtrA